MPVRQLAENIVNRIAAGEVVERPASAVKELVENALDAGATRIEIVTDGGGRRLIRVTDDGAGMTRADLALSVERHATSKLPEDDLLDIRTLGFRGEALPSIGAVARLAIATRHASEPNAWMIGVDAGEKSEVKPAALSEGTRVEVRDLFYATPARLKFLKTDRTEAEAIRDVVRRLAMSRPDVAFTLAGEERAPVTWGAALPGLAGRLARLGDVLGSEFRANAVEVRGGREGLTIEGYAALPTYTQGQRAVAISLRQRPPGARPAAARRGARRLCGLSAARPPSGRGAVRHRRAARGRRQRASGQDRGALPRLAAWCAPRSCARCRTRSRAMRSASRPPAAPRRSRRSVRTSAPRGWDWRASPARPLHRRARTALAGFAEAAQAAFDVGAPSADTRVAAEAAPISSTGRSAPRARNCTRPTSWRRRATAS